MFGGQITVVLKGSNNIARLHPESLWIDSIDPETTTRPHPCTEQLPTIIIAVKHVTIP